MIPLKDKIQRRHFPFITLVLIIANIAFFIYEVSLGKNLDNFLLNFSVVPYNIYKSVQTGNLNPLAYLTLLTSLFLHGGWLHLGGNMLYLWVFGDNVEDKLGGMRFLFFYLLCGLTASALHIYIDPLSRVPVIGASGAISGVLGAYLLMFPKARIVTLIPIFIFIQIAELPAYLLLGFWFILQFFSGMLSLGSPVSEGGGVAWWAHIGGFISGMILLFPFRKYR
jgi:membrane associated rhomboid family serine protease